MLKQIDRSDIPRMPRDGKSPLRQFANETLREFMETARPGDACEVTGAPVPECPRPADKVACALRSELFYMGSRNIDLRREVKVVTRGGTRVFLIRQDARWAIGGGRWHARSRRQTPCHSS